MIGTVLLNRYRLDAELGRGGMGVVYRAHDTLLERDVAIKVLSNTGLGTQGRARLLHEAQAAAKLNHPNIVTVYDAGESDGVPFIVMELVSGRSLRDTGMLTIPQVIDLGRQLCAALEHAHANSIVHRDIKPENILLADTPAPDASLRVKLMDFGLAHSHTATRLTQEGALVGTVFYLAPEQALGQGADARADLYSLGVVLYELAAGRLPFTASDPMTIISQHLYAPVTPPSQHRNDIPLALEAVILRLLAKNPDDRFASAREAALALGGQAEPATPPPLKTSNNLPAQATHFIGREKQVDAVRQALLRPQTRLLTLTGPGGTGKTRLGLQAAASLLDQFTSGVFFVALAPIGAPDLVPATIASAVQVRASGDRPVLERLKDYFRDKHLLLMLDGFEQVTDAAPVVADLLSAAPRLKVLVTSRRPLRIYGEHEMPVPPMALPDLKHLPPPEHLAQVEAVQLFVERAQAVKADFAVTDENAPVVAEICHRLDGLPLAIELAAARAQLLSPPRLLAQLDRRLKVLTGGARDLAPRQQTLRNTVAWSYDLLDADARQLFARLAVFVSGWTLEAAQAVCNAENDLPMDVLDGLGVLMDNSLLKQSDAQGEPCFAMLETIREYALEKLGESGELQVMRDRHLDYFLSFAEAGAPYIQSGETAWLDRLESEFDNVRAAWEHALACDADLALRLALAIEWFWVLRGRLQEGRAWANRLLPFAEAWGANRQRAQALRMAGILASGTGDDEVARPLLEAALATARASGDQPALAFTLHNLGSVYAEIGKVSEGRACYEECLALYRAMDDTWGVGHATGALAGLAWSTGDAASARALFERALSIYRSLGDKRGIRSATSALGKMAYRAGDYASARALLEQSLSLARNQRDTFATEGALCALGELARLEGDYARAGALYTEALHLDREMLGTYRQPEVLCNLGYVALHERDYARARALFQESLALNRQGGLAAGILPCVTGCAGLVGATGQPQAAARLLGAVESSLRALGLVMDAPERMEYDRIVEAARAQLDEATFQAAWAKGQAMTLEQAVVYALEETGP